MKLNPGLVAPPISRGILRVRLATFGYSEGHLVTPRVPYLSIIQNKNPLCKGSYPHGLQ